MSSGAARKWRRRHKQRDPPKEVAGPSSEEVLRKYRDARILVGLKKKLQRGQALSESEINQIKEMFINGRW